VDAHARAVLERLCRGQQIDRRVDPPRNAQRPWCGQRLTARDVADVDAAEVDRRALAGDRLGGRPAVDLDAAHLHPAPLRQDRELILRDDAPRHQRAGRHRAKSLHRERAIDRQAGGAVGGTVGDERGLGGDGGAERIEPVAGRRRHLDDGRAFKERTVDQLRHVLPDQRARVGVGQIRFRDDDDAARDAQELADVEVLAGLRHHRFVGGHNQQHAIDAADTGEHRSDEALVAGDVDKGDAGGADDGVRKAQLDGDAAGLLFLQAIGIDPGQRADERALAVIDVAGGSDHEAVHALFSPRPLFLAQALLALAPLLLRALALLLLGPRRGA
jgi:hypothetical protein